MPPNKHLACLLTCLLLVTALPACGGKGSCPASPREPQQARGVGLAPQPEPMNRSPSPPPALTHPRAAGWMWAPGSFIIVMLSCNLKALPGGEYPGRM